MAKTIILAVGRVLGRDFRSVHIILNCESFMKRQLEQRLKELRAEYASGQKALAELENKQMALRSTLLRINNAIKAIEEEIAKESS